MNKQARQNGAKAIDPQQFRLSSALWVLTCLLFLSLSSNLIAQLPEKPEQQTLEAEQNPSPEPVVVTVSLPDSHQMALALATPGLRRKALLDLAVAASVLARAGEEPDEVNHVELAQSFLDDRAWLQMLVDTFGWAQPRSAILDPAAWLVLNDLHQHGLESNALVFPGRSPDGELIYEVFQRSGQQLAVANLPILLLEIEADVFAIWEEFLKLTSPQELPDVAWHAVEVAWFTDRQMPVTQTTEINAEKNEPVIEDIPQAISNLVSSAVEASPPDNRGLIQLRYSMLNRLPGTSGTDDVHTHNLDRDLLYLVSVIDGLHEGHYFEFIQGVLSITSRLLEAQVNVGQPGPQSEVSGETGQIFPLVDWLVDELPAISAHYAVDFAKVDPRLNTSMSSAYDVLLKIFGSNENIAGNEVIDVEELRLVLADAVAQLALLIPDMGYYFDTPVRARIVSEISECTSVAASLDDNLDPAMTRRQFDACMDTLLRLAQRETRLTELSGDMNGPFTIDALRRELSVTPWQRINYGVGYLHENYLTVCHPPAGALPNPLEWAVLATTMTWFAEYFPGYFKTPENEFRLSEMRSIGELLITGLAEQTGCLAAVGTSINDPVSRTMTDYELALRELDLGIENAELDFRSKRLSPDADVSLLQDASQKTSYRPDDLLIQPCNTQSVCEMSGELSTTRALIGLFPDEYLLAEQTGMGHIEICYRNMEWVQRRSELVRADDENVANYFGRLGFDLVGRHVEDDRVSDIFGFRFTSPEEHHYLFAQATDEVLNDSCPVEWVGSRVVTPLPEPRGGLVPNRLTYLAASRTLPSRLLQNNWDRGAEWRDWFVTGIGVSPLKMSSVPELTARLNLHLQSLYQAEQADIYQRVLIPNARNSEGELISLFNEMSQVSIAKSLIRMQMMLFFPQSLFNSDQIRMAIAGDEGLLEGRTLRRFRVDNVPMTSVNRTALARLNNFRGVWSDQPEEVRRQGSVPASLMHALTRINILYRQYFTSRPEPLQEVEVTAEPAL